MIRCAHCGYENKEGNLFCTHCGTTLSKEGHVLAHLVEISADCGPQDHPLSSTPLRIGREASNDMVIDEEQVSKQHASIFYEEDQFWVADLKSTNGTYVNGKRIEERIALKNEDMVKIGTMILKFKLRDSAQ